MADRNLITAFMGGEPAFLPAGGHMPGGMAQLCEDLPWGIAVLDHTLRYVHANQTFAALSGRSVASHIGRSLAEVGSSFAAEAEVMCRYVLLSGEARESKTAWGYPNQPGPGRWQASFFPLRNDCGALCGVRIILQDVAQRADLENALQRSREELNTELKFRTLISEMFGRLSNLLGDSVDDEIGRALRHIRDFAGADHGSLLRFTEDGQQARITVNAPALDRDPWLPDVISPEDFPWYADMMRRGNVVRVSRLADFPLEADVEKKRAEAAGVKSHLFLPLATRGSTLGGISLTCFDKERTWSEELLGQLRILAQIVSSVLTLNTIELKLRHSVSELTRLRDQLQVQRDRLHEEIRVINPREQIIDHSQGMRAVLSKVQQVAATDSTVLILGETGTGKELIARAIHDSSPRHGRPMVKVNCAALPSALVESELFGREKGAYTGALTKQIGRFELAHGSTILLDEIGDLPLELQGKLLRVLQEGEFERLGSPNTHRVSARVVAATNCNLAKAVREGTFREDLYYRLNVFSIAVPPLRDRPEDIPPLVWAFIKQFGESMARGVNHIPKATMEALQRYPWPGNIRQLRNTIEHAMIVSTGRELRVELPAVAGEEPTAAEPSASAPVTMEEVERNHILAVLEATHWRVSGAGGAAEILAIKPTTLESRMSRLGIRRKRN